MRYLTALLILALCVACGEETVETTMAGGGAGGAPDGGTPGNGGGGAGGDEPMFDPPGSTLAPNQAECERGCLQSVVCGNFVNCEFGVAASIINRCRTNCLDEGQRATYTPLVSQACPGAGQQALDAMGVGGSCISPDDACTAAGTPCLDGEECAGGFCQAFACAPDANEAMGSTSAEAVDLGSADTSLFGLTICTVIDDMGMETGDEDWYSITVPGGTRTIVNLGFSDRVGDLDVLAYLAVDTETAIARGTSVSDNETLVIPPAETDRQVLLKVYTFGSSQNRYDMYVTHDVPLDTCGSDDDCAPGFGCTASVCAPLPPCATDEECGFGEICEVATGICRDCLADLDCGETSVCVDFECVGCRTNEDCMGGYCSDGACLECMADADCGGGTCVDNACRSAFCDDPYEPNDEENLAAALQPGQPTNGAYMCGDDDFYRFNVPPGQSAYLSVLFVDEEGDIDVAVFQNGEQVTRSVGVDDNEYVGIPAGDGGNFVARVYKFGTDEQSYSVSLELNPPFQVCNADEQCGAGLECDDRTAQCVQEGLCRSNRDCDADAPLCDLNVGMCGPCPGDGFEPNDALEQAIPANQVQPGAQLNTCNGPDFFSVEAAAGQTILVDLSFLHEDGDVDTRLYDPAGEVVDRGNSSDDNETIEYVTEMGGRFTVEVYGFRDVYNVYTMSIQVQ